jgi:small subunit ribosomal protein S17
MESQETQQKISRPKILKGVVVSTKMKDTVVVAVERFVEHPRYKKFIQRRKRYQAHDVGNTCVVGEKVTIKETKPISKNKHFIVVKTK